MYNLLRAGFVRLRKSKLFWTLLTAAFLWSVLIYYLLWDSVEYYGEIYLNVNAGFYFTMPLFYIGVAEAILCAFFIGTDYSDGTIRNKIFTGHKRGVIYLSNFVLTSLAGICFCLAHAAAAVLVGLPLIGTRVFTAISALPLRSLCGVLITVTNAAVFTLLSILNSNKAVAAVGGILLSFAIIVAGIAVYDALEQPEFYNQTVMSADGTAIDEVVPNPRYIENGAARDALEWLSSAIPFSASLNMMEPGIEIPSAKTPLCQVGLTIILTAAGIAAFERKNIN